VHHCDGKTSPHRPRLVTLSYTNPGWAPDSRWTGGWSCTSCKLLQTKDLRPEVTDGRQVLYDDMELHWKTKISAELKYFYFIATICDPRQRGLTFPGVSQEERLETHEWFEAEYDSLWNTSAPEEQTVPVFAPAASASLPVPVLATAASASASASASLGSFVDFMASVAHLQAPVAAQVSRVKSEEQLYLELPAAPMNTDPLRRVVGGKRDQLPSIDSYVAAVPRCPGHVSPAGGREEGVRAQCARVGQWFRRMRVRGPRCVAAARRAQTVVDLGGAGQRELSGRSGRGQHCTSGAVVVGWALDTGLLRLVGEPGLAEGAGGARQA
jgi:hypothetical protein